MPHREPGTIRNVAVIGHRGTGKTSLVESLLYESGTVNRLGSVADQSTVSDFDEDERKRGMSISASVTHLEWEGRLINLIDTPGEPSFQADVLSALRVVEGAIMTVSGVLGVTESRVSQLHTKAILRLKAKLQGSLERASLERNR